MVQIAEVEKEEQQPTFSPVFEEWLLTILAGYGTFDAATKKGVEDGMRNVYSKCKHLETIAKISDNAISTEDDYRTFFFFPGVRHMQHYSKLFASEDPDHLKVINYSYTHLKLVSQFRSVFFFFFCVVKTCPQGIKEMLRMSFIKRHQGTVNQLFSNRSSYNCFVKFLQLKFNASCVFYLAHSRDDILLRQFVLDGGIAAVRLVIQLHIPSQWIKQPWIIILFWI